MNLGNYQGEEDRLLSDKNCWQETAFQAHHKIVQLQNELKRTHILYVEKLKEVQLRQDKLIEKLHEYENELKEYELKKKIDKHREEMGY